SPLDAAIAMPAIAAAPTTRTGRCSPPFGRASRPPGHLAEEGLRRPPSRWKWSKPRLGKKREAASYYPLCCDGGILFYCAQVTELEKVRLLTFYQSRLSPRSNQ